MQKQSKKTLAIAISLSAVALLGTIVSFMRFPNSQETTASTWMSSLADSATLNGLTIPGSHDCGATYSVGDLSGKCQDASIAEQLNYGVRYFDVRLKLSGSSLYVYHGFINEGLGFEDLFAPMYSFLSAHPKEALIISIKDEADSKSADFEKALLSAISSHQSSWITNRNAMGDTSLAATRGKLYLMSRYANSTIGLDCYRGGAWLDPKSADSANTFSLDAGLYVQDHYKLNDNETKWNEALALFKTTSVLSLQPWVLNFFSGYLVKGFPPSYSVSTAKYINGKILNGELPKARVGVVICDFVTAPLVAKILEGQL
jgi:1-phosphatidylinositol phosphodiesterase